ncbi:Kinase superfamily protein [Hibiscus syriacus]|uniref:Kinase superfamily protein n=1 Tax=Hibiscus syriacus TaxID=106335 RepID=A0A6A3C5C5_HIBSY|nr:Kinase superfamily protein [Hibiscus syriacus]
MAAAAAAGGSAPIAIGTRGTVGSLLKKEIEYFANFELEAQGIVGGGSSGGSSSGRSWKSGVRVEMDCSNGHSRSGFWFSIVGWKRKKRKAGNDSGFLPSMCSAIEVADMNRFNRIPGFNYRILKNDVHNFRV